MENQDTMVAAAAVVVVVIDSKSFGGAGGGGVIIMQVPVSIMYLPSLLMDHLYHGGMRILVILLKNISL